MTRTIALLLLASCAGSVDAAGTTAPCALDTDALYWATFDHQVEAPECDEPTQAYAPGGEDHRFCSSITARSVR